MTTRPTVEPAGVSEVRRYTCSRDDGGYMYEYTELGNMVPDEDVSDNHFVLASDYDALRQQLAEMRVRVDNLYNTVDSKQAKIDALMMEFCPGEMSAEQRTECARNQVAGDPFATSQPSRGKCDEIHRYESCSNEIGENSRGEESCGQDCAQPERQGADNYCYSGLDGLAQIAVEVMARNDNASPPPTDDIVAFLRDLNHYIYRDQNQMLDRAIAALGEKGCYQQARCLICGNEGAPYLIADSKGYGIACCAKCRGAVQLVPNPVTEEKP